VTHSRLHRRPPTPLNVRVNRTLRFVGLLLGVAIVVWLIADADMVALFGMFSRIGLGFAAIIVARGATIIIDCAAWSCLLPRTDRPGFAILLPLRWIGESINTTLPVAQIGGDVVRARLLQRRVAAPAQGAASVAVDFCLSLFAQILFTLVGCILLVRFGDRAGWWPAMLSAALVPVFALVSWELLVRRRLLAATERWAVRLGRRRLAAALSALGVALGLVAGGRAALARSLALHLASFIGHAGELWLTFYLMGLSAGFAEAVLLESLSLATRSAAFLIPSGWGAQEASLIALAALTGLPPETGLALGLVKRAREFAIGLPGLAAWVILERRRPVSWYG
jgi:putative membrane protein